MRPAVVTLPGDGIGRIVVPEVVRVLEAVGFEADYVHGDIGWECWVNEGNPMPDRTLRLLTRHGLGLMGAITSKPKAEAQSELAPALRGRGLTYVSPVLTMRQRLGLEVCIRPCRSIPANPLNFVLRRGGQLVEPIVDTTLFIQNTECLFAGVEWTDPPRALRAELDAHPQMSRFADVSSEELAVSLRVASRGASNRIAEAAFRYARDQGYRWVTLIDKWGVMRETSAMLLAGAQQAARHYPSIELRCADVDTVVMRLLRAPEEFQVVLCSALLGDIVSDGFAGLVGGKGFAPSASIGPQCAVFEPAHGSAPRYGDETPSVVNPIAAILAGAMLLDHVGEAERAGRVRAAVTRVVADGRVRTYEMVGLAGGREAFASGAASTTEMTDAIIAELTRSAG